MNFPQTDEVSTTKISLSDTDWVVTLDPEGLVDADLPGPQVTMLKEQGIPAVVPGNVHSALLEANLIPDPVIGINEQSLHWVGRQHWRFSASLPELPPASHYTLVAEGLDTIADVFVGDSLVGSTQNMHRTYRFDVTQQVKNGASTISVRFTSPYQHTDEFAAEHGTWPGAYEEPYALIRKMAANYGWDWGPTVVTAGIWRDLRIEAWDDAHLTSVRIYTEVEEDLPEEVVDEPVAAMIRFDTFAENAGEMEPSLALRLSVTGPYLDQPFVMTVAPKKIKDKGVRFKGSINLARVGLWWPHTLGDQRLYDLGLELIRTDDGSVLDAASHRLGFKRVEIINTPPSSPDRAESEGTFGFRVNGVDIFARGWNWIPADPLVDRVTEQEYRDRVQDVVESGADWIRVWGGGIYEDTKFYDACDQKGVLVWQDFPFSCSSYPETPDMLAEVRAEAQDNVERLMSHPSLGIWCGNNENFLGKESWGWDEVLEGRGWGGKYYLDVLPDVLDEMDPTRPYWPGSPYTGIEGQLDNDPNYGTFHEWVCWNQKDYSHYLASKPTFASEFGWQAPPAWSTLINSLGLEDQTVTELDLESPEVLNHQKAFNGMTNLERGITEHYGTKAVQTTTGWHYFGQLTQATAVFTAVGHYRSLWPRCRGAFVWQINDCWPVISWAGVDSAGHRKPLWHSVTRAFADQLLYVKPVDGEPTAFLINQTDSLWRTTLRQRVVTQDGTEKWSSTTEVSVEPSSVTQVSLAAGSGAIEEPRTQLLVVDVEEQRQCWFGVLEADFGFAKPEYQVELQGPSEGNSEYTLSLRALSQLVNLFLQVDRVHPALAASTEIRTLLPGESRAWTITVSESVSEEERKAALHALTSANWEFPLLTSVGDFLS